MKSCENIFPSVGFCAVHSFIILPMILCRCIFVVSVASGVIFFSAAIWKFIKMLIMLVKSKIVNLNKLRNNQKRKIMLKYSFFYLLTMVNWNNVYVGAYLNHWRFQYKLCFEYNLDDCYLDFQWGS